MAKLHTGDILEDLSKLNAKTAEEYEDSYFERILGKYEDRTCDDIETNKKSLSKRLRDKDFGISRKGSIVENLKILKKASRICKKHKKERSKPHD